MIPLNMKWTRWRPGGSIAGERRFYGERRQDRFIFENYFRDKKNGYYVDAGALDGVSISTTLFFERLGWDGICIEAARSNFNRLIRKRTCYCVNSCIGDGNEVTFHISNNSGRNSMFKEVAISCGDKLKESRIVKTDTLDYILDLCQAPKVIDFMSMDIEGAENLAFSCFPFDKYRFNVILVEVMHIDKDELLARLTANSYRMAKDLGADWVFVHDLFVQI